MKLKLEELKLKSFVTATETVKGGTCTDHTQSGETVCGQECTCYVVTDNTQAQHCTTPYYCPTADCTFGEGVCGPH